MNDVSEIRSALVEFKRLSKQQLENISMLESEINVCENAYRACEEDGAQEIIMQRRMQCINARNNLIEEFRRIQENIKKLKVIVENNIGKKEKNLLALQGLPQFGSVSLNSSINVEINSATEWKNLLAEIDAVLAGDFSEDSTNTYGQKRL